MRCLSCKYDISNLTEHRCPECGREFDPNDSKTFNPGPLEISTWPRFYSISAGIFAIVFFTVFLLSTIVVLIVPFEFTPSSFARLILSFIAATAVIVFVWLLQLTKFVNIAVWKLERWRYNRD